MSPPKNRGFSPAETADSTDRCKDRKTGRQESKKAEARGRGGDISQGINPRTQSLDREVDSGPWKWIWILGNSNKCDLRDMCNGNANRSRTRNELSGGSQETEMNCEVDLMFRGSVDPSGSDVPVIFVQNYYSEVGSGPSTGLDPEDQSDEEDEKLPDLTVEVDDEGNPCLPTGFESLMLKNQQKVIQKVFQKAHAYIQQWSSQTNPRAAVHWGRITQDPDHYLDMDCTPQNVIIKDPSHLQKEAITMIFSLWKYHANLSSDEDGVLKNAPQANGSSDKDEDLESHTSSLSNYCPKFHMGGDTQTPDSKGMARKQHLSVWASWMWSEAYLPQNIHNDIQASFVALEELGNYVIKSRVLGIIVVLGFGLLLHKCCCAQEYETDEAGDDMPQYLGDSILGIKVGDKVEEAITRIQVKVNTMLPDGNEKQMTVGEEVHMRHLDNKRQVKERGKAEQAQVAEEKRVAEEVQVSEEKRVAEAS
ncbi:hypothetical protein DEU56DRAFT_755530 [Suillus clintonianus]|uniref:uncharacterized protein n=1 Tax=Suillus clintonianus TaxID=1904413 RepID=UPI001B86C217|nr:uncharacterized protein DEU56DRAFT_755530 [Suillus clintonianus]KAG2139782.1 hypothetical protein DEU56DRAFT_755530 [Suillus clintonianus]